MTECRKRISKKPDRITEDLSEVREAMASVGLSPVKLRRPLRAELGRKQEATERPLHRSPALRKIFKQAAALASAGGGSLRPAHLLVALIESGDPVVATAVTKLGHDSFAVLRLGQKTARHKTQEKRKKDARGIAEEDEMPKKKSALERFGRDHLGKS